MTEIYRRAEAVNIWLGEEIDVTAEAVRQVPAITATLKRFTARGDALKVLDVRLMRGIGDLLTRSWWSRLWTLQEAVLAQKATFLCGAQQISWSVLKSFARETIRLGLASVCRGTRHRPTNCDGFQGLLNVEAVRHNHSVSLVPDLLRNARQRICYDPRDRVYAVVGLMPSHLQDCFVWEPGESVEELYRGFAFTMLTSDVFGIVLSLTETRERRSGLPSWCPDFHFRAEADLLADHEGYHSGFNVHGVFRVRCEAPALAQIILEGSMADTITCVMQGRWTDLVARQTDALSLEQIEKNILWLEACIRASNGKLAAEDLWRVFIGNMFGSEHSRLHYLAGFGGIHDRLVKRKWKDEAHMLAEAFSDLPAYLKELASLLANSESADIEKAPSPIRQYLEGMQQICCGRKFFLSCDGRVGLGPLAMQEGDVVCIIKNAKVPFVLRRVPSTESYTLVGEAYVHGLMHGEHLVRGTKFGDVVLV